MWNGMLPIGSVVVLKDGEIPIMVTGFCQVMLNDEGEPGELYDYVGVPYPAGFTRVDEMVQFDHDAVERVLAIGFNADRKRYGRNRSWMASSRLQEVKWLA